MGMLMGIGIGIGIGLWDGIMVNRVSQAHIDHNQPAGSSSNNNSNQGVGGGGWNTQETFPNFPRLCHNKSIFISRCCVACFLLCFSCVPQWTDA